MYLNSREYSLFFIYPLETIEVRNTKQNLHDANEMSEVNELVASTLTCNSVTSLCKVKFLLNNEENTVITICIAKHSHQKKKN